MQKNRLEAFSDGVLAIIITIMVLELKVPHGAALAHLERLWPVFLSYVLSFVYIAIYWNNHHHLFHAVNKINAPIMWSNMALLFWLSLIPFASGWAGENHFAELPVALYGLVFFMAGFSYSLLSKAIIRHHGQDSLIAKAMGKDLKGKISTGLYLVAIPLAFWSPLGSIAIYVIVAVMWIVPDSRITQALARHGND